jgi:hypothetical protein
MMIEADSACPWDQREQHDAYKRPLRWDEQVIDKTSTAAALSWQLVLFRSHPRSLLRHPHSLPGTPILQSLYTLFSEHPQFLHTLFLEHHAVFSEHVRFFPSTIAFIKPHSLSIWKPHNATPCHLEVEGVALSSTSGANPHKSIAHRPTTGVTDTNPVSHRPTGSSKVTAIARRPTSATDFTKPITHRPTSGASFAKYVALRPTSGVGHRRVVTGQLATVTRYAKAVPRLPTSAARPHHCQLGSSATLRTTPSTSKRYSLTTAPSCRSSLWTTSTTSAG